jgi:hypothetical protein
MHVAVRPPLAAGVALVGASVIAASSMAPLPNAHLPELLPAIRTAEVNLAAAVDPFTIYSQVLQDALANVSSLVTNAQPGQVLSAILGNQIGNLTSVGGAVATALTTLPQAVQTAVGQLAAGNLEGAANTLLGIPLAVGLPALSGLLNPLKSVENVINAFTSDSLGTELILAGFIAPLISTPAAAVAAVQNVVSALGTANPAAILGAVLSAPATVADGLINGGYGPNLAPLTGVTGIIVTAGGLLSSATLGVDSSGNFTVGTGGPIAALEQVLKKIATALAPQTTAATTAAHVTSIPSSAATTVTLKTASTAASVPAIAAKSTGSTKDSGTATGTTVHSKDTAGSDSTKSGTTSKSGDTGSAAGQQSTTDSAGTTNTTTGKAHKGSGKGNGAHTASHASHSK